MAMPQVHIVAYCGDLGYGVARGAEMLSLMMAFGIVSRIGSGFLRIKSRHPHFLIGSWRRLCAIVLPVFDSLSSLYLISAMFGLFQGGIVPCYAIIVRESIRRGSRDPGRHRDSRLRRRHVVRRLVSGVIFDATGSYGAAFLNGLAWNALNIVIVAALLLRARQRLAMA